jgi:hypothetical protein
MTGNSIILATSGEAAERGARRRGRTRREILGGAGEDGDGEEVPEGGKTSENGDRGYAYYDCDRTTCA